MVRINILKETNQISDDIYNKLSLVIKHFNEKQNIKLTEENGAMLITHIASALTRIEKDREVDKIDEEIFNEIKNNENYTFAFKITNELETVIGKIPSVEKNFIEMHICTLLDK